jgi:hypothetical protein
VNRIHWLSAGVVNAALAAAFAHNAGAQVTCTVTVTGQNNQAVDAAAVQAATNQAFVGDLTVCLEGTFDFAPPIPPSQFSVAIAASPFTTSLRIVGLNNANGKKATIRNGRQALSKIGAGPPTFSIENLRFEQPEFSAISILGSGPATSIKVSNVNIVGSVCGSGKGSS